MLELIDVFWKADGCCLDYTPSLWVLQQITDRQLKMLPYRTMNFQHWKLEKEKPLLKCAFCPMQISELEGQHSLHGQGESKNRVFSNTSARMSIKL
jgi:hypothetical protein